MASAPIFTALLAPLFDTAERSSGTALAGIVIGIVGVGLILGVDLGDAGAALGGGLMVLAASVGYAVGGFMVKRSFSALDAIGVVTMTMALSALLSLPLAAATPPEASPGGGTIAAMVALGIGGTGIAFAIFYTLIARLGPARASLVAYIAPGFAVFYGVTLQGRGADRGDDRRAGADRRRIVARGARRTTSETGRNAVATTAPRTCSPPPQCPIAEPVAAPSGVPSSPCGG